MRAPVWLVLVIAPAFGCDQIIGDPNSDLRPGEDLGTFAIAATLEENTCGQGAFGATDSWSFEIRLSREERFLYWDNGAEMIQGDILDDDVSFQFISGVRIDLTEIDEPLLKKCTLMRNDLAAGSLSAPGQDVESATGSLTYLYEPEQGADCTALFASQPPVVSKLPCTIGYSFTAQRIAEP